jgi:hypothetical protein
MHLSWMDCCKELVHSFVQSDNHWGLVVHQQYQYVVPETIVEKLACQIISKGAGRGEVCVKSHSVDI